MAKDYRGFPTAHDYYIAHFELHPLTRTKLFRTDSGLAHKLKEEGKWEGIPKARVGPSKGGQHRGLWGSNKEYPTAYDYFMEHLELHRLSNGEIARDNSLWKNFKRNGLLGQLFPDGFVPGIPAKDGSYISGIDALVYHESSKEGRIFGYADLHLAAYGVMRSVLEHGELTKIPENEKKSKSNEVLQREFAEGIFKLIAPVGIFDFNRIFTSIPAKSVDGENQRTLYIGGLRVDYRHDQYLTHSLVIKSNRSENPPIGGVYKIDLSGSNRVRLLKLFKDGSQTASANFELSNQRRTIRAAPDVKIEMKEIGNGQHLLSIAQGPIPEELIDLIKRIDSILMGTYISLGGVPLTERQFMNWMFSGGE
ncbi:hypothetical protein HYV80_07105 [Candidatus Woesearchaeota archaeon]|nr:hypothetical protein [Candidatus Woesearchaeota archaeon]